MTHPVEPTPRFLPIAGQWGVHVYERAIPLMPLAFGMRWADSSGPPADAPIETFPRPIMRQWGNGDFSPIGWLPDYPYAGRKLSIHDHIIVDVVRMELLSPDELHLLRFFLNTLEEVLSAHITPTERRWVIGLLSNDPTLSTLIANKVFGGIDPEDVLKPRNLEFLFRGRVERTTLSQDFTRLRKAREKASA